MVATVCAHTLSNSPHGYAQTSSDQSSNLALSFAGELRANLNLVALIPRGNLAYALKYA